MDFPSPARLCSRVSAKPSRKIWTPETRHPLDASTKARILIVDDVPANLLALRAVLSAPNYELIEAESGHQAVRFAEEHEFALIVLDVQMPGLDGYQTAKQLKSRGKNKETPIIFVTAVYREDPFVRKGYDAGAIDYFGKPFDPDILKAKVGIYTELYLKTKRLEENQKLLKTHEQVKTLLEAIPVGIVVTDQTGEVYESNEEARRIWPGALRVRALPADCEGWEKPDGHPVSPESWVLARALRATEKIPGEQYRVTGADGGRKTIVAGAVSLRAHDGRVLGAVMILQDFTSRSQIAHELHQTALALLEGARIAEH